MKKIDWKDYITVQPSINEALIKLFAQELNILYQSLSDELSALKEQQKTEIQRLQLHKITNLDAVLQRHCDQLSKVQDEYNLKIKALKKEQKCNIYTFSSVPPNEKVVHHEERGMFSVSFGTVMPKIYHVDFQVFSEIKHDLDSFTFNARVDYVSDLSSLCTKSFYKESQKSTEFYYPETFDQLKEIKDLSEGDFFITRHSNLESKVLFHLMISDNSFDCKSNSPNMNHKTLLGLRSIVKLCVKFSISELVIPVMIPYPDLFKAIKSVLVECPWNASPFKLVFTIKQDVIPTAIESFHKVFDDVLTYNRRI
jgi:hypothetical protein